MSSVEASAATVASVSGAVEALLLLAEEPMAAVDLAQAVGVPEPVVTECLVELAGFYDRTNRGFELRRVGGGWRYYTRDAYAELIAEHVLEGRESRLSPAALETLAVIAYSQPISRARVSAVRGVSVDGVIKTLLARGLIVEAGHDHESGAVVFGTTRLFLERMGLNDLDDLPPLAPHLPEVEDLEAELSQLARAATETPAGATRPDGPGDSAVPGDQPDPPDPPDQPDRNDAEERP